jgi:hypothetical protein
VNRSLIVTSIVLVLAALTACTHEQVCTLIGRGSTISVDVTQILSDEPSEVRVRVCVETTCNSVRRPDGRQLDVVFVDDPAIERVGPVHVTLLIETGEGKPIFDDEANVALDRRQPNGPDCPPTYYSAALVADPRSGLQPSR